MKLYKPIYLTAFVSLCSINELNAADLKTSSSKVKALDNGTVNQILINRTLLNQSLTSELFSDVSNVQASINDELSFSISANVSESLSNMKDDVLYMNANYDDALAANQGAH